jgi:hypothetical protein
MSRVQRRRGDPEIGLRPAESQSLYSQGIVSVANFA